MIKLKQVINCYEYRMLTIAFLSNKLTLRGTEMCIYDFADYNEKLLGNKSLVITRDYEKIKGLRDVHKEAYMKFTSRFPVIYYENPSDLQEIVDKNKIDILFITKAGEATDGLYVNNCKTVMHCVFSTCQPHGTVYCTISECVNRLCRTNFPVLHNPVRVAETNEDLREILNIPKDATVFGAYCGADEYNEEDVVEVVKNVSKDPNYSNVYFIFMNVDVFGEPNERLIFLPGTSDMIKKRQFINTCDAMLYGRKGGETFGISVGEFSICNKPVIARGDNRSDFHITTLGDDMIKHFNYQQCFDIITNWEKYKKDVSNNGYNKYRLENVMKEFVDIVINS